MRRHNKGPRLSSKFDRALRYAARLHRGKLRKKTKIPDVGHVLGVTAIALEYGANETEAIGALLHDAAEDAGGRKRLRDIQKKFGDAVAKIVDGCTDSLAEPTPAWLERKKRYVAHVRAAPVSTKLVSASDKLQNVRSILRNYLQEGDDLWQRYDGGKEAALWYYRALVKAFTGKRIQPLVRELDRMLSELELLANDGRRVNEPPVG
jgi:(p)ppGpp synthase/HD superfamily hydrolase